MSAITIRGLDHVVLRVAELERSLRFYCGVLGCEVVRRNEKTGLTQLRAGDAMIDLVPREGEAGRNMDHFALAIETYDEAALRAHLEAHGVAPGETRRRFGAGGTGPSMYITDPDGNVVELKGPCE